MKISSVVIALLILIYTTWYASHAQPLTKTSQIPIGFKGTFLAASDADMIGGAYANGILNKVKGIEDSLSYISIQNGQAKILSQQFASNSVISWPAIIAWQKDKQYAYVAETRGVYQGNSQKMENVYQDFPQGNKITVIDLKNPKNPQVVQQKVIGENLQGVSINQSGNLLVAGSTEIGKELVIARLKEGLIDQAFYFTHKDIDPVADGNSGFRTIEFHPTENIIAVNMNNTHLIFYQILDEQGRLTAEQIGEPLKVAKKWSVGNWHPSGKYFMLSDVAWGNGNLGFVLNGKGKIVSVKLDKTGNHQIVSKVKVGLSPEGFDVSPDGNYAIMVNMRRTWAPPKGFWFVPARKKASLTLIKINSETGELKRLGKDYGFIGALPEDAIFDQESNSIAVAVYQDQEDLNPTQGWIDFWELKNDQLFKTNQQVKITRGVHNLLLLQ